MSLRANIPLSLSALAIGIIAATALLFPAVSEACAIACGFVGDQFYCIAESEHGFVEVCSEANPCNC